MLFIMMFFCTESPRWLYKVGRQSEARATLLKVLQPNEVDAEFDRIAEDDRMTTLAAKSNWSDLFKKRNNMGWRTTVAVAVLFFQQLTGINAVFYFAPVIFNTFLDTQLSLLCNLLLTAVNFLCTFIAIAYVDKYGRRTLLVVGGVSMVVFCLGTTILSSNVADYKNDKAVAWTIVGFLAAYVVSFSYSWGPVGWIVPAEIFPNELRGKGMTLSTTGNWLSNFAVGKFTPSILRPNVFNLWGTFLFFGGFCALMTIFTLLMVPETAGVPLEDMSAVLDKFRSHSWLYRLTHVNLKINPATDPAIGELEMQRKQVAANNGKHHHHHLGHHNGHGHAAVHGTTGAPAN
jgi:sugar porter (SP) family MFS transporter